MPFEHPYLDAVLPAEVVRVGPPPPAGDPWAPSPWLRADYVRAHAREADALHLHFGFDSRTPTEIDELVEATRAAGLPLVVTVHDLRNPHHVSPERHDAHLTSLVGAARCVLTLTAAAAAEIEARFGRSAVVVEHPGLVAPQPGVARESGLVGIHLKGVRTNVIDPMAVVISAAEAADRAGGRLRVDVQEGLDLAARLPGLIDLAEAGRLRVEVHPRYDDGQLTRYLQTLAVSVLPYRFGTHSGWLEACRDVGTLVVAPSCGHYAAQWSGVITYVNDEVAGFDPGSLARAIRTALSRPQPDAADAGWRHAQRQRIRATHAEVYAAAARVGQPP